MPSLSSFLPTEKPEKSRSTNKAVMPLYPAAGSTVAKTTKNPASAALVIHNLRPVSRYSAASLDNTARVVSANASEPEPASDNAYDPTVSRARRVRKRRFWSSVPQRCSKFVHNVFCTSTMAAAEGSTRASSSIARIERKNSPPCPPYSSGTSMPISPSANISCNRSLRNTAASSISRTCGAIFSRAKRRTVD